MSPSFFRKVPRIFLRPIVALFDWKKKRDMERLYASEGDHWGRTESMDQIASAIDTLGGRTYTHILDVGTGEGYVAEALVPHARHVTAIDISEQAIASARARLAHVKTITFLPANIRTWKTEERFDLVVLADVLYYLGDTLFPDVFTEMVACIASFVSEDGEVLVTHYVAPWRGTAIVDELYTPAFVAAGLVLVKDEVYRKDGKEWRHLLFKKPARPASV